MASAALEQDDHAREAGILTGEAMLDGVVVEQVLEAYLLAASGPIEDAREREVLSVERGRRLSRFPRRTQLDRLRQPRPRLPPNTPSPWTQFAALLRRHRR